MKPMFFGDSERKLYGVYDAPTGTERRSHAVLLCYPGVQEYNTSHWSFRRLASLLARDGHHVMRFDYFGSGDSSGSVEEGTPEIWIDNIRQATAELKDLSGARQLSVLGKRLGATLAALACEELVSAHRLLLWDPVVDGGAYVQELEAWDARRNLLLLHAERSRGVWRNELLGFPFPAHLRATLHRIDLRAELPRAARRIAIFANDDRPAYRRLCDTYVQNGLSAVLKVARDAQQGEENETEGRAQLSGSILTEMVATLTEGVGT
jgi:pimeloyl-ACP methyl ester carboxylesterase